MTYTPTKWKKGDVVTSVGLNNIEDELVELDSAKQDGGMGYYEEVHLVDQTIPVAEWTELVGLGYVAAVTMSEAPVIGREYKLIVDGVETTVTCYDDDGAWVIDEDYDVLSPPAISGTDKDGDVLIATAPTADVHVELIGPVLHKINNSFYDPFFVAHNEYSGGVWTLEETWNDIKTALDSGKYILCFSKDGFTDGMIFYSFGNSGSVYYVAFFEPVSKTNLEFKSNDPDGVLSTGAL